MSSFIFALFFTVLVAAIFTVLRTFKPRIVTIFEYQRGVMYAEGRLSKILEPGRHWASTRTQVVPVDMRTQLMQMPGQEIITTDGIAVKISAYVEYAITDPALSINSTNNLAGLLYSQAQQALRSAVSEITFESLLVSRTAIGTQLIELLTPRAATLGIGVSAAQIRDIMLPSDIRRAYTQAITAQKEGLAALERGRAEVASLRALANAARMLQEHPGLLQLRAVQAIETSKGNHTLKLDLSPPATEN